MCLGRQPNISSKLETLESQWYSSGPKVDRFKIQEDPMFQFQFEGRKRPMSSSSKQAGEDMRGVKSHQNYSWKIKKMIFCQILLIAWIRWKKKNKRSSLLIVGGSAFLFSSVLWLNDGHPYQRGQSPLLSLPSQMFISSKTTLIDTPGIMFNQLSGHPMAQSHKINHHRVITDSSLRRVLRSYRLVCVCVICFIALNPSPLPSWYSSCLRFWPPSSSSQR